MFKNLNIEPGEKIASIGCGGGLWEVAWSFEINEVTIFLQDIDATILNISELKSTIAYFEKQFAQPTSCKFEIIIGTKNKTNLAQNYFDKILIINSLHEFEQQNQMLTECQKSLKLNGQLIIQEQLAQYQGQIHNGCGKPLFLADQLIAILNKAGFILLKSNTLAEEFTAIFIQKK